MGFRGLQVTGEWLDLCDLAGRLRSLEAYTFRQVMLLVLVENDVQNVSSGSLGLCGLNSAAFSIADDRNISVL